jgi:hypothetical protein
LSLACFDKVLYVVGKGRHKGTMAIAQAWMQHPEWPTLTLTSFHNPVVDNILANLPQRLPPIHLSGLKSGGCLHQFLSSLIP